MRRISVSTSVDTTRRLEFSFLTSGPMIAFDVPQELSALSELHSPIISGRGARSWVYTPNPEGAELIDHLAAAGTSLGQLEDLDGRAVSLYRRLDPPLTWWLTW